MCICPVCQVSYDTDEREMNGKEWAMCSCGTWAHVECVSYDIEEDPETFCPICTATEED